MAKFLVIAEKPSVAQSLAKNLSAYQRKDGYLEGNSCIVSWCLGHLAEYAPPEIYDEKYAKTCGINVTFYQFLISLATALVVVLGMRLMGTLLISSLIVFPAIIARKLTNSFKGMVILSAILSVVCFIVGIMISFVLNFPTGASIVAVYLLLLLITTVYNKILA